MIKLAYICEYGFNEFLPNILMRQTEDIKKIKKKKQNNAKHTLFTTKNERL